MDKHFIIEQYFDNLIDKMKQQSENPKNQSFGSLDYHLNLAIKARTKKEYLSPLYYVHLPRGWANMVILLWRMKYYVLPTESTSM